MLKLKLVKVNTVALSVITNDIYKIVNVLPICYSSSDLIYASLVYPDLLILSKRV